MQGDAVQEATETPFGHLLLGGERRPLGRDHVNLDNLFTVQMFFKHLALLLYTTTGIVMEFQWRPCATSGFCNAPTVPPMSLSPTSTITSTIRGGRPHHHSGRRH